MSELPPGWVHSNLGHVCDKGQYGWTTKASSIGEVKFLRTTDITKRKIGWSSVPYCHELPPDLNKYLIRANDILISRAGSVGFSTLIDFVPSPTVFASYLIRFVPSDLVVPRYLAYYMRSPDYWHQIGNASAGVALANVNASKLTDLAIPVAPFAEQKRIADKLDNLMVHIDVCRDRLDRLPTIIKQFRQSVLDAATSGRLTEECREKNCVSRKWAERSLLSLTTKITDGEHITPKRSPNGKCLLSARNIQNGSIALGNVDYVDDLEFDRIRRRCDPEIGDVLLSCSGSVGRVALVDRDNFYVMVRSAAMIRPRRELLNATYLMYSLQSPALQSQIKAKSSATAQANIFLGAIRELVLPLPGLPEQAEIVRRVEALFALADRLEARVKTASARIDTLTPATLAKALRGELVPQDPSDEPARALLGRIRAERAAPVEVRPRTRRRAAS